MENQNFNGQSMSLNQMDYLIELEKQNKEKVEKFKTRIAQFEEVSELEDAKALAKKILPTANEKGVFRVGNAKCTVINKADMLRISLDAPDEFIGYDFE